jgi:hypothetical protein
LKDLEERMLRRRREKDLLLCFFPVYKSITTHLFDPKDHISYARQDAFFFLPLP